MYTIEVTADSRFPVDRKRIRRVAEKVLKDFGVSGEVAVSVMIVGDRKMKQLNENFRKKEGTTDVLSFPTEDMESNGKGFVYPKDEPFPLGDVVISYPEARAQAIARDVFVDDEIEVLLKHGVKSLLGHHD